MNTFCDWLSKTIVISVYYDLFFRNHISIVLLSFIVLISHSQRLFIQIRGDPNRGVQDSVEKLADLTKFLVVNGGLSDWTKWSSCSSSCGVMERHRSCTNPKPAYGGKECFKLPVQMRQCGSCTGTDAVNFK